MTNQVQEILDYIKEYPGVTVESIVGATGWNRHLVEIAVKLMVEQGLVKEVGQTDWLDFRYEAIDLNPPVLMVVSESIHSAMRELWPTALAKDFPTPSPFQKVTSVASGIALGLIPGVSEVITQYAERKRLLAEIATLANVTPTKLAEFCQSTPYSLEFIKAAIQAGAKLDEEDIKRTMLSDQEWTKARRGVIEAEMEEKATYFPGLEFERTSFPPTWADIERAQAMLAKDYTFTVTFPNGDRREIKAAYMDIDGGTLYFEDEDHDTILAYGPGHWVWAERKESGNEQA